MKQRIPALITCALIFWFLPAFATAAAYLKIGDIKGEAMAKENSTEVQTIRWMAPESVRGQRSPTNQRAAGGTVSITKRIDKSSPKLAETLTGGHMAELSIADGGKQYLLKNVQVVSVQTKGEHEVATLRFQHRQEYGQVQSVAPANHNTTRSNRLAPAQPNSNTAPATDYNSSRSNKNF